MARPSNADIAARTAKSDDDSIPLLTQYGLDHLPETFSMRDGDSIIQEREPCYICRADGFYGRGTAGTWYAEGSIIVTDIVPNDHLEPLNRAAAIKYVNWLSKLPNNRAPIDVGDMAEAATMLAKDPQVLALSSHDFQKAVIKLSEELKLRREGKNARDLPGIAHNFAPQSGRTNAPPILGAKMAELSQRGPGFTNAQPASTTQNAGARRAGNAGAAAIGGAPPV